MTEKNTKKTDGQTGVATADNRAAQTYNSINDQVWGEGGTGYAGEQTQVILEKDKIQNDPIRGQAFTQEELDALYKEYDITDTGASSQRTDVMTWEEGAAAGLDLKSTSDPNYGYVDGTLRPVKEGDSGADEALMTDADYQLVQHYKSEWNRYNELAKNEADPVRKQEYLAMRDQQNTNGNRVRLKYGYSGGSDGSLYLTAGQLGIAGDPPGSANGGANISGANGAGTGNNAGGVSDLKGLLDAWKQAATQQSDGKIDYAVQQAVAELERALADAQPQFREQAESVDRDARQAMDNSALYAELRGDKGGIGQEQYNSIQNTQAQNRLAVQQAQTRLATDTQRQIADLRAQGRFEQADAALQITQQYLAQLISLEQWAAEYNLSVEQFNASLQQWEAEYNLALQKFQTGVNQWQAEFDYSKQLDSRNRLARIGEALLAAGIPLTGEQMDAMNISPEQADKLLIREKQNTSAEQGSGADSEIVMDYDGLFAAAEESGRPKSFIANNYKKYGFTANTGLYDDYQDWAEIRKELSEAKKMNEASILALGLGSLSEDEVMSMVIGGVLEIENHGNSIIVHWADGWDAERYRNDGRRSDPDFDLLP